MKMFGVSLLALGALAGCAKSTHMMSPSASSLPPSSGREIRVTTAGFEPGTVTATAGEPCTLMVMRTTDTTCAREFVMDEHGVREPLPLNQRVRIVFTHDRPGEVHFSCDMGMMAGSVMVR